MIKIGIGQDSHKFSINKKPLILGGIKLSEIGGFEANSDGDVIIHSLCNALSSAIGGYSLGTWSDEMYSKKGIKDSKKYLNVIFNKIQSLKYNVGNVSFSIEAKKPKISIIETNKIKKSLADLLKIQLNCIGITFTSGDNLSDFGKGLGINVICAVLLLAND